MDVERANESSHFQCQKVLILPNIQQTARILSGDPTSHLADSVLGYTIDRTSLENTHQELFIRTACLLHKIIFLNDTTSLFGWCCLILDTEGFLHRFPLVFSENADKPPPPQVYEWAAKMELPPKTERFVKIKSSGSVTALLSATGSLWTRGLKADGTHDTSDNFVLLPAFTAEEGQIGSSLGPSYITHFYCEGLTLTVILGNGAVLVLGFVQTYNSWDKTIKNDGFIELTASTMKPRFIKNLSKTLSSENGNFGLFGQFKPCKYYPFADIFLTDEGVVFMKTFHNINRSVSHYLTPLDPSHFNHCRIITCAQQSSDVFVSETGILYLLPRTRQSHEVIIRLQSDIPTIRLEIEPTNVKQVFMATQHSVYVISRDGFVWKHELRENEEEITDVTPLLMNEAVIKTEEQNIVPVKFLLSGIQTVFLFQ
ncbi:hypothetical protein BLNAU_35 [Blattamonas nauphoetae]|uniref:Uncharacterized protein n=1 Tax=Blattamonas nauphoetae TaxID=2049346 RepID=A0ABQ9YLU6_9EUKA|nr:hypothetical protein BLNAU_35 [Blattamonas nauphoetae]